MKTFLNIIWHVPFLGFIFAIVYALVGAFWCITIIGLPLGLGLLQFSKFLFHPFGYAMVNKSDLHKLNETKQNPVWKTFAVIVRIIYFPFGLLAAISNIGVIVVEFVSLIGIPSGIVWAKSFKTIFNPINKVCVPESVAKEIQAIKDQKDKEKYIKQPTEAGANIIIEEEIIVSEDGIVESVCVQEEAIVEETANSPIYNRIISDEKSKILSLASIIGLVACGLCALPSVILLFENIISSIMFYYWRWNYIIMNIFSILAYLALLMFFLKLYLMTKKTPEQLNMLFANSLINDIKQQKSIGLLMIATLLGVVVYIYFLIMEVSSFSSMFLYMEYSSMPLMVGKMIVKIIGYFVFIVFYCMIFLHIKQIKDNLQYVEASNGTLEYYDVNQQTRIDVSNIFLLGLIAYILFIILSIVSLRHNMMMYIGSNLFSFFNVIGNILLFIFFLVFFLSIRKNYLTESK